MLFKQRVNIQITYKNLNFLAELLLHHYYSTKQFIINSF